MAGADERVAGEGVAGEDGAGARVSVAPRIVDVPTPSGTARVHIHAGGDSSVRRGLLILGHGAGGGVGARDLTAARDAALDESLSVALVEQPYRVAGRRSPAPAHQLDAAWIAVVRALLAERPAQEPLIVGGRSSGARVACRTAGETAAAAVLCLAFPLRPPGRAADGSARPSRVDELDRVAVPVLVVQGARDPFGMPPSGPGRTVVPVPGDHSLRENVDEVRDAVRQWLGRVV